MNTFITQLLGVAIGGAIGAAARYGINIIALSYFNNQFNYALLCVNLLGSFIAGFIALGLFQQQQPSAFFSGLVVIGFLGAFTTFSAFSLETINLLTQSQWNKAILTIFLNVFGSVLAAFIGMWCFRQLG